MSEEKNVPNIRFKGFTDPWEQRKLGNVGEVHSGVGFPEIEQGGTEGIAFYKVSDMNIVGNESVMKKAHNYVNTEQIEKRNWKIIKHVPAIIFAKVGAAIMLNRKRIVQSPFLIDNNIMTYIFDKSWDVFFGKTLFDTINLPKYAQTGALPSYNASDIKNIKVLIPNKNLQTKIGVLFKKIDTTIALHQQKVTQLKELKKLLMQKIFDQEWRFRGFTDPWEQRKLGECLNVNSGKDYKSLKRGNIPVYGTGGYMCSVDQALSYNEDAIGIGRKGTINKPYILKAPFWTVDTLFYIVPKAKLNLFFMYLIFQKVNWKRKDESTGVPSLSKSIIKSVKELFPKGREQNEIAELFEILDTTIALHQQKVDQLKELKKYLMQNLFV
ncbi:restriction endonuclease subunit S [Pediococcus acidilactici]